MSGALTTAVVCVCAGCTQQDMLVRSWTLTKAPPDAAGVRVLTTGMSKDDVVAMAGDAITKPRGQRAWSLPYNSRAITFDSRRVYLYFDQDGRLAAIIVRGSYPTPWLP